MSNSTVSTSQTGATGADDVGFFIEVGTSDFNTLVQGAAQLQAASDSQKNGSNSVVLRGLSVEALKIYQDRLPSPEGVRKINAAIVRDEGNGTVDFFFVEPADIVRHNLSDWIRGGSSAGHPNEAVMKELRQRQLTHLMHSTRVPTLTFDHLLRQQHVDRIGLLKVDAEGAEPIILDSLIAACVIAPHLWPATIAYEQGHVDSQTRARLLDLFQKHGFHPVRKPKGMGGRPRYNVHSWDMVLSRVEDFIPPQRWYAGLIANLPAGSQGLRALQRRS